MSSSGSLKARIGKSVRLILGPKNKWPFWLLIASTKMSFRKQNGYRMDFKNPVTFGEKRLWYSLLYRNPVLPEIVDKVSFKPYIEKKLGPGHTIPLLGVWDNVEELEKAWDALPEDVVLKSNCSGNENNVFIIHHRSQVEFSSMRNAFKKALDPMNTLLDSYRWAYQSLTPKILAEEFRTNSESKLYDYKFFCFNGEPKFIYVDRDHTITLYDMEWNRQPVQYMKYKAGQSDPPERFQEMSDLARKLSAGFPFVRVDFYDDGKQVYAGEMTFYAGGIDSFYTPASFDELLGSYFDLKQIPSEHIAQLGPVARLTLSL